MSIAPRDNRTLKTADATFPNLFSDDINLQGNLDLSDIAGALRITGATTVVSAGSVNRYLQVSVNGTSYRVALLNIS